MMIIFKLLIQSGLLYMHCTLTYNVKSFYLAT